MNADKPVTVPRLIKMKREGVKITALTAYDATFAALEDAAGVDMILVGDSAGMVIAGDSNTIPVSLDEMVMHTRHVRRGVRRAMLVADMPFGNVQESTEQTIRAAVRLMKEGGAEAVKVEGAGPALEAIQRMTRTGIPVVGHLGLTPQYVHSFGGFRLRGRKEAEAERIRHDARALEEAGVFSIVLEKIPAELAAEITAELKIPTIGIGSGRDCDGQILVNYDLFGLSEVEFKFVRKYLDGAQVIRDAVARYAEDIRNGSFPSDDESFHA